LFGWKLQLIPLDEEFWDVRGTQREYRAPSETPNTRFCPKSMRGSRSRRRLRGSGLRDILSYSWRG
jgi:hypothetical protein